MRRLIPLVALLVVVGVAQAGPPLADRPGTIRAAFGARSYAPGARARLVVTTDAASATLQVFRAGPETARTPRNDLLQGVPASEARRVVLGGDGTHVLRLAIGNWPSGLYFARLEAPGRLGFAPFVLRPRRLGQSRIAVVLPTNTWQAYNFRDVDGDGVGDTWYASASVSSVDLTRPFLDRGVPPHFRGYDRGFLRWLAHTGKRPDVLSDDDLEHVSSGDALARRYDLVVFPGHEEYVTGHVFDVVTRYRDRGGNLMFLSANTFFYRVVWRGERLYRTGRWRDVGRWEAPLTGGEYVGWFENRYKNQPFVVTGAGTAPWLFRGTGLRNGDSFGRYGIEIDQRTSRSPRGTIVLARIASLFGPGRSAEMTYYETRGGSKVFAAGAINFGGTAEQPGVSHMLENLWARLSRP